MKNIVKLLVSSTFLISFSGHATQTTAENIVAQINLGAVYTNVNDYKGSGFKASAKINFPMGNDDLNFYGKLSQQTSHDEKQSNNFYFDESELSLGISYNITHEHRVFLEGGNIKQNFEQNEQGLWKDYLSVIRIGTQIQQDNFNIQVALEQRDGIKSDTGYNTCVTFFENRIRISYTDVGNYQSLGLSFQASF